MRSSFFTLGLLVLLLPLFGAHSQLSAHPSHSEPPNEYSYDPADTLVAAQLLDNPEYYDAGIAVAQGLQLLTWLEFVPGQGDYVWFGTLSNRGWEVKSRLTHTPRRQLKNPTLTVDGAGVVWLSYEAEDSGQWDVYVRRWQKQDKFSEPPKITPGTGQNIQHATAPDPLLGIHVVWQAERDGQFDIMTCCLTAESHGAPELVSQQSIYSDWDPDIAVTDNGTRYIAWDSYDGNSQNIYARVMPEDDAGGLIPVGQTSAFEGKPSLATDGGERVWILWEEGGRNWGKMFNDSHMPHTESHGALHRFRDLRLAMIDEQGQVYEVEPQPPTPMFGQAVQRAAAPPGSERIGCYYERGRLAWDDRERLWLVYRHFYAPKFLGARRFDEDNMGLMYGIFARYLNGNTWSDLYRLEVKQGDGDQRMEVTPWQDGVAVAWTVGRTHRNYRPVMRVSNDRDIAPYAPRGVAFAQFVAADQSSGEISAVPRTDSNTSTLAAAERRPDSPAMTVAGQNTGWCLVTCIGIPTCPAATTWQTVRLQIRTAMRWDRPGWTSSVSLITPATSTGAMPKARFGGEAAKR